MSWNSSTRIERNRSLLALAELGLCRAGGRAPRAGDPRSRAPTRAPSPRRTGREQRQQLLQERAIARGGLVQCGLLDGRERVAVRRGTVAAGLEAAQAHQPVRATVAVEQLEQPGRGLHLSVGRVRVAGERAGNSSRAPRRARRAPAWARPRGRARAPPHAASRRRSSASAAAGRCRTSRGARAAAGRLRRRTRRAPRRTPRTGGLRPAPRRARGSAGRGRPRADTRGAGGRRSRGSSRSRRRRACARGRGARAPREPRGCACAARPPPGACT